MVYSLIGIFLLLFLIYLYVNGRRGLNISKSLYLFKENYDDLLIKSGSKERALREALEVFKSCPRFNQLSDSDLDRLALIIGPLNDPKNIVERIIMKMDSKDALRAFHDEKFLQQLVSLDKKYHN